MASLTDDPPAPPRKSMRSVFLELFPWLARFGLSASGALAIKSAAGRTELEGGGSPALASRDIGGRLIWDAMLSTLFYSPSATGAYVAVTVSATPGVPPLPGAVGTTIALGPGSQKVSIG